MACMTQSLLPLQLSNQEETALQAGDRKGGPDSHAIAPWSIREAKVIGYQVHVKVWAHPAPFPLPLRLPFWLDWKPAGNTGVPAATPRTTDKLQPGLHSQALRHAEEEEAERLHLFQPTQG